MIKIIDALASDLPLSRTLHLLYKVYIDFVKYLRAIVCMTMKGEWLLSLSKKGDKEGFSIRGKDDAGITLSHAEIHSPDFIRVSMTRGRLDSVFQRNGVKGDGFPSSPLDCCFRSEYGTIGYARNDDWSKCFHLPGGYHLSFQPLRNWLIAQQTQSPENELNRKKRKGTQTESTY